VFNVAVIVRLSVEILLRVDESVDKSYFLLPAAGSAR
jgi:hypothetical protein